MTLRTRNSNRRMSSVVGGWLLVLMMVLAACSPAAAPGGEAAAPGGASATEQEPVVILQGVDVTTLDPQYSESLPEVSILQHMFETLTTFNDEGELIPLLAESWENVDELTWEFKIKEGRTFHNGEPVNAEAFAFSMNRGQQFFENNEARVAYEYGLLNLESVEVVDEYTLRIVTKEPNPIIPVHVAHLQTAAYPPKYYSETPQDELHRAPVGSGPYRFVEWIPEERVVIEAWGDYPDGAPAIQTLIWRPVPEAATRIAELKAGNADIIVNVPPDLGADLDAAEGARLATVPGMRRIFVGLGQNRHPALQDVRVRRAFNHAFNCDGMMENLLAGLGECSAHIINAPNWNPEVTKFEYDPELAKQLMAEAGWTDSDGDGILDKDGEKLSLTFDAPNARYIKDKEIAQVIASDLQAIGVEVNLQVSDWSVYVQKTANRGEGFGDMHLLGSGPGFECQSDLALVQRDSGSNRSLWSNDEFEAIWAELNTTFDPAQRLEMCHQLEKIAFDDAALLFIWLQTDFYGASDRLNWSPRKDERILLLNASLVE